MMMITGRIMASIKRKNKHYKTLTEYVQTQTIIFHESKWISQNDSEIIRKVFGTYRCQEIKKKLLTTYIDLQGKTDGRTLQIRKIYHGNGTDIYGENLIIQIQHIIGRNYLELTTDFYLSH